MLREYHLNYFQTSQADKVVVLCCCCIVVVVVVGGGGGVINFQNRFNIGNIDITYVMLMLHGRGSM
jgi:hypothetical protein